MFGSTVNSGLFDFNVMKLYSYLVFLDRNTDHTGNLLGSFQINVSLPFEIAFSFLALSSVL